MKSDLINMQRLTAKEEEVMNHFWSRDKMFVRELLELYDDPKPHFNTLSTIVRALEDKGFLYHNSYGNTYQYYPVISKVNYQRGALKGVVSKYFKNSYLGVVSSLIEEEEISIDELRGLIEKVEKTNKAK
jgi:predicted transcriptional regulator